MSSEPFPAMLRPGWNRPVSAGERDLVRHVGMWGVDGYPVAKVGSRWHWVEVFGVRGAPKVYRTKRAAIAAVDAFLDMVRDGLAREAYDRAMTTKPSGEAGAKAV